MSKTQTSLCQMEELREQLHLIIIGRSLTDPEVLVLSQRLDQALNECRYVKKAAENEKR